MFSRTIHVVFLIGFIYFFFFAIDQKLDWENVWAYRSLFFHGWLVTIGLSVASLLLSLFIGLLAALSSQSNLFSAIYKGYVEIIRGTPLLVQILFFTMLWRITWGLKTGSLPDCLILSFFNGAYIGEMIRSGIETVSMTQRDSARAIGLSRFQSYRFVIFPQAIRQIIPSLTGQFA